MGRDFRPGLMALNPSPVCRGPGHRIRGRSKFTSCLSPCRPGTRWVNRVDNNFYFLSAAPRPMPIRGILSLSTAIIRSIYRRQWFYCHLSPINDPSITVSLILVGSSREIYTEHQLFWFPLMLNIDPHPTMFFMLLCYYVTVTMLLLLCYCCYVLLLCSYPIWN